MAAKTGAPLPPGTVHERRRELFARYKAGVRDFNTAERAAIGRCVEQIDAAVRTDYPAFARLPWAFIKVADAIEGGLPHTRGKYIVLPERACGRLVAAAAAPGRDSIRTLDLLLHEKVHVFQRLNPIAMDELFTQQWGFVRAKSIEVCPWLTPHHLANPDSPDCRWVIPIRDIDSSRIIWPLVILADGADVPVLSKDMRMLAVTVREKGEFCYAVDVDHDGRPVIDALADVRAYTRKFPHTGNLYHPNEISASLFALVVVVDHFMPPLALKRPRLLEELTPLRNWYRKIFRSVAIKPAEDMPAAPAKLIGNR